MPAAKTLEYLTLSEAVRLDAAAIRLGIPSTILMENAGNAMGAEILLSAALSSAGGDKRPSVVILAGVGNNGGDGLVAARYLTNHGLVPEVFIFNPQRRKFSEVVQEKYELLKRVLEGRFHSSVKMTATLSPQVTAKIKKADVLVDALFGTGLSRPLDGVVKKVVSICNESKARRISLDIPSGLATLHRGGAAFQAHETLTVQETKQLFLYPWFARYTGTVKTLAVDYPPSLIQKIKIRKSRSTNPGKIRILEKNRPQVTSILGPFPEAANNFGNKFTAGRSVLCSGSARYPGAGILSAHSALLHGASYLYLLTPAKFSAAKIPQLIPLKTQRPDFLVMDDFKNHKGVFEKAGHILFGPGTDRDAGTTDFLKTLLGLEGKNLIFDADGLHHFGILIRQKQRVLSRTVKNRVILTPHLGEFHSLLNAGYFSCSLEDLQENLFQFLTDFSRKFSVSVLLKDAHTFYTEGKDIDYLPYPNPFLAKAGSGDILAGRILARLGRHATVREAVLSAAVGQSLDAANILKQKGVDTPITALLQSSRK